MYNYPKGDTSAWSSIDTTGLLSWKRLYNSPEYWEDGAFNVNSPGHPDYGWGVYNSVTHSVVGDSIYIIRNEQGKYQKLWIVQKISVDNIYELRYSDLDGSNEVNISLDIKPYIEKNFVYYSLEQQSLIDREPADNWDILFTKYIDYTEDMSGNMVEYLVTGATSNVDRKANKFTEIGADFDDWAAKPFDSLKNTIGYDWKIFSMTTFSWEVDDSIAFFVKNDNGDVYKIVFTYWQGSTTGEFALSKELVSASAIDIYEEQVAGITLYPNPVKDIITIETKDIVDGSLIITDISGRIIYQGEFIDSKKIAVNGYDPGVYFVTVVTDGKRESGRFIVL